MQSDKGLRSLDWINDVVINLRIELSPESTMASSNEMRGKVIEDFHPDLLDWGSLSLDRDDFFTSRGIKVSLQGIEYQEYHLHEENVGEFKGNGIAQGLNGQEATFNYGRLGWGTGYYMCHNAPKWHEYHKQSLLKDIAATKERVIEAINHHQTDIVPS